MVKEASETRGILSEFREAESLTELALKVIDAREECHHIDPNEILFLQELETRPNAAAKTFNLQQHPMQFYTDKKYCIVFYEANIDYYSLEQKALLMFHELLHIPAIGRRLVDHDIKDFFDVLSLGIDWSFPGAQVPDILKPEEKIEVGDSQISKPDCC